MRPIQDPAAPDRWMLNEAQIVMRVHPEEECTGRCPIHAPSDHHMRSWPMRFNTARTVLSAARRGRMERQCPHEVWHPDPDNLDEIVRDHDCDGCCDA